MDGTKRPNDKAWVSKGHVVVFCDASVSTSMLPFPRTLHSYYCLAEEESDEKKLVY